MTEYSPRQSVEKGNEWGAVKVRPITLEELDTFASCGQKLGYTDEGKQYIERMFTVGSIRPEWCFVAEDNSGIQGRLAFWTLPGMEKPMDLVLLDLDWERTDFLRRGTELLSQALDFIRGLNVEKLGHVLDLPAMAPQWQHFSEKRIELLEQFGFQQERETIRFEFKAGDDISPKLSNKQVIFQSLQEVGEAAFIEAIRRVSERTLDRQIEQDRQLLGELEQAKDMFDLLKRMKSEPAWWELAFTPAGDLIGLVMPTESPTYATIGYIGVVPEQRGQGYIQTLLQRGTSTLCEAGATEIRADTDVNNKPMAAAFCNAGYRQFATRREYGLKV